MAEDKLKVSIITLSDRAYQGSHENKDGPAIREWLTAAVKSTWDAVETIVTDEQEEIEKKLIEFS